MNLLPPRLFGARAIGNEDYGTTGLSPCGPARPVGPGESRQIDRRRSHLGRQPVPEVHLILLVMAWEAKLGGQFVVLRDGTDLGPPPNRTVGVLLVGLLRHPGVWIGRSQLASTLYREQNRETARTALRQTILRFKAWLGDTALESQGDCLRLSSHWICNLALDSGEPAPAAMIAPFLDHDWIDEVRSHWRPAQTIENSTVAAFDQAVRATAMVDRNEARAIFVGGQNLLWQMPADNVANLLALVRPARLSEPAVHGYLEVRGTFESRTCALANASETFERAYRVARSSEQRLDAERIASWALYSVLESADISAALEWRGRLGNRHGRQVLVANALAAEAWNRNMHDRALAIMRPASRDLTGADRTQKLHFWSNYAVLSAESGEISESEDAEALCRMEGLGILDTRWSEILTYAQGLRLMHRRETGAATSAFEQFSLLARKRGWSISALYAEELTALAWANAGDGRGAASAWARASALRGGISGLNPRRRAIYDRVCATS